MTIIKNPTATTPPSNMPVWNLREEIRMRRELEKNTTLLDAPDTNLPEIRHNIFSSSSEDILRSGALSGKTTQRRAQDKKTRAKKIEAYMSLNRTTIEQTKGWRIRAAYRMVCYMGRITGELTGPMTLSQILQNKYRPDPSTHPFIPKTNGQVYGTEYIKDRINKMEALTASYTLDKESGTIPSGMTYLPPPVPDCGWKRSTPETMPTIRKGMQEPDNYDPEEDKLLGLWLDAYEYLSGMLRLPDGSEEEPEAGPYGTIGMFSPRSARFLWPVRDELLIYEGELMLEIFDQLCESSAQVVEQEIVRTLGYGRAEAVMLAKTALRYGTQVYQDDFDMNKIKELKSLEIISDTAKIGDDPRAQLAARKQLQLVSGLTKNDTSDAMEVFRDLANRALDDKTIDELEE